LRDSSSSSISSARRLACSVHQFAGGFTTFSAFGELQPPHPDPLDLEVIGEGYHASWLPAEQLHLVETDADKLEDVGARRGLSASRRP
jgi:hypothetical protein